MKTSTEIVAEIEKLVLDSGSEECLKPTTEVGSN